MQQQTPAMLQKLAYRRENIADFKPYNKKIKLTVNDLFVVAQFIVGFLPFRRHTACAYYF